MRGWAVTAGLLLGAALWLAGAGAGAAERRIALVIGNNDYRFAPKLRNAVADSRALKVELEGRGFQVVYRENADRRTTNDAVEEFLGKLSTEAVGLFYFSGHGVQIGGANYMIPIDLRAEKESDIAYDGLELARLLDRMSLAQARFALAIIDACRDNPFKAAGRSLGSTRGLAAPVSNANGIMVVYAAGANQQALDRLGATDPDPNGLFTRELLKALRQPGLKVQDVVSTVKLAVIEQAKRVGHVQTPAVYDQSVGTFYFSAPAAGQPQAAGAIPVPAPAPAPFDREALFWQSIKDSGSAADFEEYLRQFPSGTFAGLARNRIAALGAGAGRQAAVVAPSPPSSPSATPAVGVYPARTFKDCAECPEMVVIPAGSFRMGSLGGTAEPGDETAVPVRTVTFRRPFAMGRHEVTHDDYDRFTRATGRPLIDDKGWGRGRRPVVQVPFADATAYAAWLSAETGKRYRLPSEAEWEYAARAGTETSFWWGERASHDHANYGSGVGGWFPSGVVEGRDQWEVTAPVGSFPANPFGLHDMQGNAWEWVVDCWNDGYAGAPTDGSPWMRGDCGTRILRGGSWGYNPLFMRAHNRVKVFWAVEAFLHYGIRLVRELD